MKNRMLGRASVQKFGRKQCEHANNLEHECTALIRDNDVKDCAPEKNSASVRYSARDYPNQSIGKIHLHLEGIELSYLIIYRTT